MERSIIRPRSYSATLSSAVQRSPHTRTHVQRERDIGSGSSSPRLSSSSDPCPSALVHPDRRAFHENPTLTAPSSPRRAPRLHTLQHQHPTASPPTFSAIPPHLNRQTQNSSQDVLPASVSESSTRPPTVKPSGFGAFPPNFLESLGLSSFSVPNNGHISNSSTRLRTYNQVFHSPSDLAAHHGIPQSLPPPPRTTPRRYSSTEPSDQSPLADFNFASLCSNYLTMLSPKNADQLASTMEQPVAPLAAAAAPLPPSVQDQAAAQAIFDALQASPDFDFLTSPLESPLDDDMLTTPAFGSADLGGSPDIFTSPVIPGYGVGDFGDLPSLFGDMTGYESVEQKAPSSLASTTLTSNPDFDTLYTMSPDTPALDPLSLQSRDGFSTHSSSTRRRNQPTGTRKNVTPETLVPLDAPIQPRKYTMPSQTSRKELPVTFARKRARSAAFGNDDDLATDDGSVAPVTMTEEEAIKAKRLQNTLAARRSRKRKLEYQRELEDTLEAERKEKEMWKARALVLEALLRDKGHDVPRIDA